MNIVIIRHADPDYSIDSLTPQGIIEAELLSRRISEMDISNIYCSPLGRARATAQPTLEKMGREAEILDWLREFPAEVVEESGEKDVVWDRMPAVWTKYPESYTKDGWYNTPVYEDTDVKECYDIVCKGFDELLAKHGYKKEKGYYRAVSPNRDTIVLFCHFGVECVLLSRIWNISPMIPWHGMVCLPTGVTVLTTEEREEGIAYFRCSRFGDLSHLDKEGVPPSFSARFCETYDSWDERH